MNTECVLDITDSELSAKENRDVFQSLFYVLLLITRLVYFFFNVSFSFIISSFNIIIDIISSIFFISIDIDVGFCFVFSFDYRG